MGPESPACSIAVLSPVLSLRSPEFGKLSPVVSKLSPSCLQSCPQHCPKVAPPSCPQRCRWDLSRVWSSVGISWLFRTGWEGHRGQLVGSMLWPRRYHSSTRCICISCLYFELCICIGIWRGEGVRWLVFGMLSSRHRQRHCVDRRKIRRSPRRGQFFRFLQISAFEETFHKGEQPLN